MRYAYPLSGSVVVLQECAQGFKGCAGLVRRRRARGALCGKGDLITSGAPHTGLQRGGDGLQVGRAHDRGDVAVGFDQ